MFSINKRDGNYEEIDSNQQEIPKALKKNEQIRVNFRRNDPISKKEANFMFFKNHFPFM